jgi:hypothetical protein
MKITIEQLSKAFGAARMEVQHLPTTPLSVRNLAPHTCGTVQLAKIVEAVNAIPEVAVAPEIETCQAIGGKRDGTMEVIPSIPLPPELKAQEIVGSYFGYGFNDDDGDASMALECCKELVTWLKEQGRLK